MERLAQGGSCGVVCNEGRREREGQYLGQHGVEQLLRLNTVGSGQVKRLRVVVEDSQCPARKGDGRSLGASLGA